MHVSKLSSVLQNQSGCFGNIINLTDEKENLNIKPQSEHGMNWYFN